MSVPVLRFYARTLSEIYNILPYAYACLDKEIQFVLAFARDNDRQEDYTTGKFFTYFFDNITPRGIQRIKNDYAPHTIKFFLSIGGRDARFPFAVNSDDTKVTWINHAKESLQRIIREYHFDGIDVYYEHIKFDKCRPYFANSIASVIGDLKGDPRATITKASITVSDPLKDNYKELYNGYAALIDNVVYQCFAYAPDDLVAVFHNELFPCYPREKMLAGYNNFQSDQTRVIPDIFVRDLTQLLREGNLGSSKWLGNPAP